MSDKRTTTLPTDSQDRKNYPLLSGCLKYFPAALAGVAKTSKLGNDKHNPGQEMHHARNKSMDHGDCILRHLVDTEDLLAAAKRSALTPKGVEDLLSEVSSLVWRALAYSQMIHEQFGAPLAPGAIDDSTQNWAKEISDAIDRVNEHDNGSGTINHHPGSSLNVFLESDAEFQNKINGLSRTGDE